jgi:hypothetical protein
MGKRDREINVGHFPGKQRVKAWRNQRCRRSYLPGWAACFQIHRERLLGNSGQAPMQFRAPVQVQSNSELSKIPGSGEYHFQDPKIHFR